MHVSINLVVIFASNSRADSTFYVETLEYFEFEFFRKRTESIFCCSCCDFERHFLSEQDLVLKKPVKYSGAIIYGSPVDIVVFWITDIPEPTLDEA